MFYLPAPKKYSIIHGPQGHTSRPLSPNVRPSLKWPEKACAKSEDESGVGLTSPRSERPQLAMSHLLTHKRRPIESTQELALCGSGVRIAAQPSQAICESAMRSMPAGSGLGLVGRSGASLLFWGRVLLLLITKELSNRSRAKHRLLS